MNKSRLSGILLHPTSLPGNDGIGTLGKSAYKFVDWLYSANQSLWQILPLCPTGYGDSPYSGFSIYAGNHLLIDLDLLYEDGWLDFEQITPPSYIESTSRINYHTVILWKNPILKIAASQFLQRATNKELLKYSFFKKENMFWLDSYATFMSIKEFYDGKAVESGIAGVTWFNFWDEGLASYNKKEVDKWIFMHSDEIEVIKIVQYFFWKQWKALKTYANTKGVLLIGDAPIFVASDSADVWANQSLFQLNDNGAPLYVAGVPPDYFSSTGQLWGNPLYDWDEMRKTQYEWWVNRIKMQLSMVDFLRIDHFRGFQSYWSIPADDKIATNGKWNLGPGHSLFDEIKKQLGTVPIIAEDLGFVTDDVLKLRDDFAFPGMKILQFAFDSNESGKLPGKNPFLPHMYSENSVVYTGTHDNSTMQGWLEKASLKDKQLVSDYLGFENINIDNAVEDRSLCKGLVKLALASIAKFAIIPMQDILCLNDEARMNIPSTTGGENWQWRMSPSQLDNNIATWLKKNSLIYGRNL